MTANQAPNPLPPTLPAGTRTIGGCVALETWKLRGGSYVGMTRWPRGFHEDQLGYAHHEYIDWSTYKPAQPETGGAKSFDFGPFTQADWDWLLGEARKQDPEAVVFFHAVRGWLVTSSLDGTGMGRDRGDIRSRLYIRESTTPRGWENGLGLARRERRIYPDDCREARARWSAQSPAGVGSADASTREGEECGESDGTGRADIPTGASRVAAPCNIPEPTLAEATRYCAECRAPMKARPGREVCRYCDLRCGGHSDRPPHEAMRHREESASQRMALMDERERPRSSRWSRELERAHPWSNDDD
jgi:hypothetical protein